MSDLWRRILSSAGVDTRSPSQKWARSGSCRRPPAQTLSSPAPGQSVWRCPGTSYCRRLTWGGIGARSYNRTSQTRQQMNMNKHISHTCKQNQGIPTAHQITHFTHINKLNTSQDLPVPSISPTDHTSV